MMEIVGISGVLISICLLLISCYFIYRTIMSNKFIVIYTFDLLSKHLLQKTFHRIGVDTEYYRGNLYQGRLCLIQLFIKENSRVIILDFIKMNDKEKEKIGEGLKKIFTNPLIEKVFHSCPNDLEWLHEEFHVNISNIFDTQEFDRLLHQNNTKRGLNHLLRDYLNIEASNESKNFFQKSNWLSRPLSLNQLNYAAMDSYHLLFLREAIGLKLNDEDIGAAKQDFEDKLSLKTSQDKNKEKALRFFVSNATKTQLETREMIKELYLEIIRINEEYAKENNINPELLLDLKTIFKICNSLPYHSPTAFDDIVKKKKCDGIDISQNEALFNAVKSIALKASNSIHSCIQDPFSINEEDNHCNNLPPGKTKLELIVEKFSCKHPVYESCKMLSPDGEALCVCDNKKMQWYVSRNLAETISQDPPVFRLLFEPNEKGCNDEDGKDSKFYTTERLNRCVVCGSDSQYMRFHIVPVLYRQFFPEQLKSHKSHDVNLLCFACNEKANQLYEIKKKEISVRYGVPLIVHSKTQAENHLIDQLISKTKTLNKKGGLLPTEGKLSLKGQIFELINQLSQTSDYSELLDNLGLKKGNVKIEDLSDAVIAKIGKYKPKKLSSGDKKNLHGKLVIEKLKDLKAFIKEWRNYFVEKLEPKFLPSEWRIDHQIVRTFGKLSQFKIAQ